MKKIHKIVKNLIQKYDTTNPIELANHLGIIVKHKPYSQKTKGLYVKIFDSKFIIINCNLKKEDQEIILSHILGHSLLHFNNDTIFAWENSLFPQGIQENEANIFALELITNHNLLKSTNYQPTF
ncbi:MAG: ImmA/IrrE family metallo-endopeptidase [Epulopiscium sp.]|jgi:Zn-dependent peptidase ImmA (M78 family)|nr:ImmA/IrrE family metallo-endopeptidase [Candidatus Epulonipiscium sp.]